MASSSEGSSSYLVPCLVAAAAVIGAVAYFAMWDTVKPPDAPEVEEKERPKANANSKAEVPESSHNFVVMQVGTTQSHTFLIKSAGTEPLQIVQGKGTCKCTISEGKDGFYKPGEEIEITLTWEGKKAGKGFQQSVPVYTSDPDVPKIEFTIKGNIAQSMKFEPQGNKLSVDDIDDKPVSVQLRAASAFFKEFKILKIETGSPLFKASHRPLNKDELDESDARCGYDITVTVLPITEETKNLAGADRKHMQVGGYRHTIKVYTDKPLLRKVGVADRLFRVEKENGFTINIVGIRLGPIKFRNAGNIGAWSDAARMLDLQVLPRGKGAKARIEVVIKNPKGKKVDIESVEADSADVKAEMKLLSDEGSARIFVLDIDIPDDRKPAVRTRENSVVVTIKTNHPHPLAKKIEVRISYAAQ